MKLFFLYTKINHFLVLIFFNISVYQSLLNHAANNPTYTAEEVPLGYYSAITFTLFLTLITTTSPKPTSLTSLHSSSRRFSPAAHL